MTAAPLETVELEAPGEHRWSVIWLHGLGADGHDFAPIAGELPLPARHGVRFIFPHAPYRPVTINAGMTMRAWYDIAGADLAAAEDAAGIRQAGDQLAALIARERERGIDDAHIVVAGFSQGGAIALHTGLRHGQRLAGIIVLSAYLPLAGELAGELAAANHDTPIFQGHGDADEVVPSTLARSSAERIAALRPAPGWHSYRGMGHGVCPQEIADVGRWLTEHIGVT